MARAAKIDEQISYSRVFFACACLFAAVTAWALWDESFTRREWKRYSGEIVQRSLEDMGRVDRCETCHTGIARSGLEGKAQPGASHPMARTLLGLHPPERFGCTVCHDGQGRATTAFFAHAPDLNDDPDAYRRHSWPTPLLRTRGAFAGYGDAAVPAHFAESTCVRCHADELELRSTLACAADAECAVPGAPADAPKLRCDVPSASGVAPPAGARAPARVCVDADGRPALVDLAPQQARGRKIIEEVGCAGCHPSGGPEPPKPGPDLRHLRGKIDPSWLVEWIKDPRGLRPGTRMPAFFPEDVPGAHGRDGYPARAVPEQRDAAEEDRLADAGELWKLRRDRQQALMASFLLSASDPFDVPAGRAARGDVRRGEALVRSLGCLGCHALQGSGIVPRNHGSHFDHGPDLGDTGAKTSADWLYAWLKDPRRYAPATRMPNLRLSDGEAADVAAFLASRKATRRPIPDHRGELVVLPPEEMTRLDATLREIRKATSDAARRALEAKLSPAERAVRDGRWLVRSYGCHGCHLIKGLEAEPPVGASLAAFASKSVEVLDFADAVPDPRRQTWESWTYRKLTHPRVFRYDRSDARMPEYAFTEQEVKDVMVALKGMRGEERDPVSGRDVPLPTHALTAGDRLREDGRRLVRWYNCWGCHTVDGHTGDLRQIFPGDRATLAPPALDNEGARTQPAWLFGFLERPQPLRPWLESRMPTFGFSDGEASTLAGMFSALDRADFPYRSYADLRLDDTRRRVAAALFDELKCQSCHVIGQVKLCAGATPEPGCLTMEDAANKAPDLLLARSRLRAEWIVKWLENPDTQMPGTRMPAFFSEGSNMLDDLLATPAVAARFAGLPRPVVDEVRRSPPAQMKLLADYIMTLEPPPASSAAKRSTR